MMHAVATMIAKSYTFFQMDQTQRTSSALFEAVRDQHVRLDTNVANGGVGDSAPLGKLPAPNEQ